MGDVVIFKTTQYMGNGIDFANIAKKLIAQPFAFRRPAHQAGNIDKAQTRRNTIGRGGNFSQIIQPFVGHGHIADIRLNSTKRKIGGLRAGGFGQRIEQG